MGRTHVVFPCGRQQPLAAPFGSAQPAACSPLVRSHSWLPFSLPQKAGVHLKGFAPSLDVMLQYRVLLAPLRYGAGLKGKVRRYICWANSFCVRVPAPPFTCQRKCLQAVHGG